MPARLLFAFTILLIAGLLSGDPMSLFFAAVGAFIPACGVRGTWWWWSILSFCSWLTGSVLLALFGALGVSDLPESGHSDATLTIAAIFASSLAGSWLNWATSRVVR